MGQMPLPGNWGIFVRSGAQATTILQGIKVKLAVWIRTAPEIQELHRKEIRVFERLQPPNANLQPEPDIMEPARMEQFIIDHAERYKRLVAAFKPSATNTKGPASTVASPEIVVSARVRPMLEDEISRGFPVGIHLRRNTQTIDVHALKQPVRGLPTITVGYFFYFLCHENQQGP